MARSCLRLTPRCPLPLQNVAHRLLGVRFPDFPHRDLTGWWDRGLHASLASTRGGAGGAGGAPGGGYAERDGGAVRVLQHYLQRLELTLQVVDTMELVARTSELARVFGIDFFSVRARPPHRLPGMCRGPASLAPPRLHSPTRPPKSAAPPHYTPLLHPLSTHRF